VLIINADDWGRNRTSTDNSLSCFKAGRITSASAMVFMKDSERSAEVALEANLDVGLHVNFTLGFDGPVQMGPLIEKHRRISQFLLGSKYNLIFYNPLLRNEFYYVYRSQYEEFLRLYNKQPGHINGHHHMHFCANMFFGGIIQAGEKVRRNFTFVPGEKIFLNRLYRRIIDKWITKKHITTDFFFSISPLQSKYRILRILELSKTSNVELLVHPELVKEYDYLMSDEFLEIISDLEKVSYSEI